MKSLIIYSVASDIILTTLMIILIVGITYLLFRQVIREYRLSKEEKNILIEGLISKSEMNSVVAMYMDKMGERVKFGLIYIDLDKFEDFMLAFGKDEANTILKNVAKKLKQLLPKNALVSNYTRDEFLIFMPEEYNKSQVLLKANKILEVFREPIEVLDKEFIDLTASIAIAYYPNHGNNIKNLLQSLNLTIYKVKKNGGNALRTYSTELTKDEENFEYFYQVKNAIANKEFDFFYQPIYNIKTKEIYAYEALIRWDHPEHGIISPYKFINILEQSGDIHWVGVWGFETLIKKHIILSELTAGKPPKLSMNLSPKQLLGETLVKDFSKLIRRNRVDANNFILEIGEFALFEKQQVIIDHITKLKQMGFLVAIDGFGIDIETFEKLEKLNIDIIKVDYNFIEEQSFAVDKHMEILNDYTKDNRLVIVQGIEEEKDENRIKTYNISLAQGYFYSKPLESDKMLEKVRKNIDS